MAGFLTRDIGFAIRDALENKVIPAFEQTPDGYEETPDSARVTVVDVSDADNPKIHLDNGQVFTVRVIVGER